MDRADVEVDIMFRSGIGYRISPVPGGRITAAMVNVTAHAKPITSVLNVLNADGTFETHVFGHGDGGHRLFTIYGRYTRGHEATAEFPYEIRHVEAPLDLGAVA